MFWDVILNSLNSALNQAQADLRYPRIVAAVSGINGLATGSTLLYTNNSGKTLIVQDIVPLVTAAATITAGPTMQIGSTPTGSDVYGSIAIAALTTLNKLYHFGGEGMSIAIPNGDSLYSDITVAATGTGTPVLTLEQIVIGFFV